MGGMIQKEFQCNTISQAGSGHDTGALLRVISSTGDFHAKLPHALENHLLVGGGGGGEYLHHTAHESPGRLKPVIG